MNNLNIGFRCPLASVWTKTIVSLDSLQSSQMLGGNAVAETNEILRRLTNGGVEFVIIGGVAAIAYGSVVATDDVDICAPMARENLVKLITCLSDLKPRWRFRPDMPVVQPDDTYLGLLKNVYLRTPLGILDVLGEIPGVCSYEDAAARAVQMDFHGVVCKVVDVDTLIAAKRVAGRDHDLRTIPYLDLYKQRQKQGDEGDVTRPE